MLLVNGVEAESIPTSDRGLNYGDGVWETIVVSQRKPKLLAEHLARLQYGINVLKIKGYSQQVLMADIDLLLGRYSKQDFILKIIVTRGSGGRGYSPEGCINPCLILSTHNMPIYPESYEQKGIKLDLCDTRLSINPQLAGFKHLNRLEQVMARSEVSTGFAEGIVRDTEDHVIEATMSNVFIVVNDQTVLTPELKHCGIEGIARAQVINKLVEWNIKVWVESVSLTDLEQAKGLFLTNSVIRLWPVWEFQGTIYEIPRLVRKLQESNVHGG
ncbi:MAG: aminodeoxychorismate lyase [Thiotrichaceae bacterium]|nr:aminodeoxychorismate lyase [Thiotrichaceae bacterium]